MANTGTRERRYHELATAARGGRVASTGFLSVDDSAWLAAKLRGEDVGVTATGGYPGARRRVVTAFPQHVPHAEASFSAVYFEGAFDEQELRQALVAAGVPDEAVGDIVSHRDGHTVIVLKSAERNALSMSRVGPRPVASQLVPIELAASGKARRDTVVVPSLRLDALGAKAFRVSRSYFSKGLAAGKVKLDGVTAGKSSVAALGAEVYAEGLGRFMVEGLHGETKRGNLKVELEVEQ